MYDNIGEKIKGLAKVMFIVGAIAAVIGGLVLLVDKFLAIGLLTLFLGPVVAWVYSWLLYGFGELIDNACIIAANTRASKKASTNLNTANNAINKMEGAKPFLKSIPANQTSTRQQCPHCGETITSKICAMCGKENNLFK